MSDDLGAYDGVDCPEWHREVHAISQALNPMRQATKLTKSVDTWCKIRFEWAKKVFPNATSDEEAVDLLWDQIFKTCRIYEEDPIKAWEEHEARLVAKS